MNKFKVIIYWSKEDEAFAAEVHELPGCKADGAIRLAALKKVETIINEWIATAKELSRTITETKGRLVFE